MRTIRNDWLEPSSWSALTEWRIVNEETTGGYTTPAGFITDGGSVPWGMRNSVNPTGKGFPAYIAHDHKCKRNDYPRKKADDELRSDLIECKMNKRRAKMVHLFVRAYAITTGKK